MSNPFKDRLQRLHGARRRATERAETNETTGTFHSGEAREFEDLSERDGPTGPQSDRQRDRQDGDRSDHADRHAAQAPSSELDEPWLDHDHAGDDSYGRFLLEQALETPLEALFERFADGPAPEQADSIAFLDTETTGLSNSDYAFCAGLGFWQAGDLRVRIFHMRSDDDEAAMLKALSAQLSEASALCTFNGRTFDLPLLERRYAHHDLGAPFERLSHLDLLPAARKVFPELDSHKLTALEETRLDAPRHDDLPGREAPRRWSRYLQTGRFSLLQDVFDHNRRDILALVALLPALNGQKGRAETRDKGGDRTRSAPGTSRDDQPSAPSFEPEEGSVGSRLKRSLAARKRSNRGKKKGASGRKSQDSHSRSTSPDRGGRGTGSGSSAKERRWSLSRGRDRQDGGDREGNGDSGPSGRDTAPGERLQELRKEASELLGTDPGGALTKLHELVALSPQHAWALERLVRLHRQRGQTRLARHYGERLKDTAPF